MLDFVLTGDSSCETRAVYLSNENAAVKSENFLFDEIGRRLAIGEGQARRVRANGGTER